MYNFFLSFTYQEQNRIEASAVADFQLNKSKITKQRVANKDVLTHNLMQIENHKMAIIHEREEMARFREVIIFSSRSINLFTNSSTKASLSPLWYRYTPATLMLITRH